MGGTPQFILYVFVVFQFLIVVILFYLVLFVFQYYFSIVFSGTKEYFNSSLKVCYESCQSRQFSISQVSSFHVIYTLGTMCNLSLGVWETHLDTLCPIFEKKKCMFMLS
jgi:hypothetical protein